MVLKILLWGGVVLLGFLWWQRRASKRKNPSR
jgi:hypothetical protein